MKKGAGDSRQDMKLTSGDSSEDNQITVAPQGVEKNKKKHK